jgi:hypothetical protein
MLFKLSKKLNFTTSQTWKEGGGGVKRPKHGFAQGANTSSAGPDVYELSVKQCLEN